MRTKNESAFAKGDKVLITDGPYTGQTGTVSSMFGNGAMIERDVDEERRFCPVMFGHFCALTNRTDDPDCFGKGRGQA